MLTPSTHHQILCGKAATLDTIAEIFDRQGYPYKMVRVINPVTKTSSPGIEVSKSVYNNMIGAA